MNTKWLCNYLVFLIFQLFVVQLEMEHVRGKLNLQKLWFYIQPTMIAMSILNQITSTICKVSLSLFDRILSILQCILFSRIEALHFRQMRKVVKYSASYTNRRIISAERRNLKNCVCSLYKRRMSRTCKY